MIRMSVERPNCVTLRLSNALFIYTIMASVATKRHAENKSYKTKYKALKQSEKGTPE